MGNVVPYTPIFGDAPLRLPKAPECLSAEPVGWRCPNCGSAHAPQVQTCPIDKRSLGQKMVQKPIKIG